MQVATLLESRSDPVGKKKPEGGRPSIGKPINFRAPDELVLELEYIADGLGLDVSAVVRMILTENIDPYRERAVRTKQRRESKKD